MTCRSNSSLHLLIFRQLLALTIFFVPYIVFEIPSNILLKRFSPRVWLSGCMFLFGLVSIFQGLVQNYSGLVRIIVWIVRIL